MDAPSDPTRHPLGPCSGLGYLRFLKHFTPNLYTGESYIELRKVWNRYYSSQAKGLELQEGIYYSAASTCRCRACSSAASCGVCPWGCGSVRLTCPQQGTPTHGGLHVCLSIRAGVFFFPFFHVFPRQTANAEGTYWISKVNPGSFCAVYNEAPSPSCLACTAFVTRWLL